MSNASDKLKDLELRRQQWKEHVQKQEDIFNQEEKQIREEIRRSKQSKQEKFLEDLTRDIARDYDMSLEQAKILVGEAWQQGHSCGFQEVRSLAHEYGEWVSKILDIQRNIDY